MGLGARFLYRVVRNEAMKQDPPEIYGWRVFLLACSACFGGMLFGMDVGIIGGVLTLPAFKEKYKYAKGPDGKPVSDKYVADLTANIVSTLQAGCFVGSFLAIFACDRLGRRTALLISGFITTIGCIMQAAGNGHLAVMYIGRLVAGLGVGAASMATPLYVSENAPRAVRGALTGLYQLFIATGVMLAFWCNYGSSLHQKGAATYVIPLVMQSLPALVLMICMWFCNESPRWLARVDRWEEACNVMSRIRGLPESHPYIQEELHDIQAQLEHERSIIKGASFWDLCKEMWIIPGNRKRALISVGLMICQQMTGTNAINYYAPQIFNNLGIRGTNTGLFATGIYGVVKMVTCACFLLFAADSLGRRRSLLWTSIAQGCSMYYIGLYVRISPPIKNTAVPPQGYVALVCIFLFAGFFQFGWGPCCWIYVSEIPTARLRAVNVAIAAATQWLFNFVVARATPNMMVTVGAYGYGAFLIYGSFCFSMFFFVWFFVPETKGISLERMDELFGVTELAKDIEEEAAERHVEPHEISLHDKLHLGKHHPQVEETEKTETQKRD